MGKFQPGNPGGPGRPPKVVEDAQHAMLLRLFDEHAERAIIENMIRLAKRGSSDTAAQAISAATWLWDRKYGKVKDAVDHGGELIIRVVRERPDRETA